MTSKLVINNKYVFCWFYVTKHQIGFIPNISIIYKVIPFTIVFDFLKYRLQFTFKRPSKEKE
jgi:hypothetical protein